MSLLHWLMNWRLSQFNEVDENKLYTKPPFQFVHNRTILYLSTRRNGWFTIELSELIKFPGPSVLEPQNPLPLPGKSFFKCAVSWRSSGIGWRVLTWMIKCWKQPAISKPIICVSRQVPAFFQRLPDCSWPRIFRELCLRVFSSQHHHEWQHRTHQLCSWEGSGNLLSFSAEMVPFRRLDRLDLENHNFASIASCGNIGNPQCSSAFWIFFEEVVLLDESMEREAINEHPGLSMSQWVTSNQSDSFFLAYSYLIIHDHPWSIFLAPEDPPQKPFGVACEVRL